MLETRRSKVAGGEPTAVLVSEEQSSAIVWSATDVAHGDNTAREARGRRKSVGEQ